MQTSESDACVFRRRMRNCNHLNEPLVPHPRTRTFLRLPLLGPGKYLNLMRLDVELLPAFASSAERLLGLADVVNLAVVRLDRVRPQFLNEDQAEDSQMQKLKVVI